MADSNDQERWVTTDPTTIRRLVSSRGGRPAVVPEDADEDAGAPRIGDEGDEGVVETDWDDFFDRLAERGLAVAARREDGGFAFEVVPQGERGDEAPPEAIQGALEDEPRTDDPTAAHNEDAREETNPDNYRDEPPFNS